MRLADQETLQEQITRFMKTDDERTFIDFGFGYGFHITKNDVKWFDEWEPEFLASDFSYGNVLSFEKVQELCDWLDDYATLFDSVFEAMDYCTIFEDATLDFVYVIYS